MEAISRSTLLIKGASQPIFCLIEKQLSEATNGITNTLNVSQNEKEYSGAAINFFLLDH